jgi:hypothetical protein
MDKPRSELPIRFDVMLIARPSAWPEESIATSSQCCSSQAIAAGAARRAIQNFRSSAGSLSDMLMFPRHRWSLDAAGL